MLRPWDSLRIEDDGEPLAAIDPARFSLETPHPYLALGAPYPAGLGPWVLRVSVLRRLDDAQQALTREWPGARLHLLDAWRPLAVQAFMVAHTDAQLRRDAPSLSDAERQARVFTYWAPPDEAPTRPPPHSTGAAVDLTLRAPDGRVVDMGSPFDEPSERSHPDHFSTATDPAGQAAHALRRRLAAVMTAQGFVQHPQEWWHFSYGDRAWARAFDLAVARYGRVSPPAISI